MPEHEPPSLKDFLLSQQRRLSIIEQRKATLTKIQGIEVESQTKAALPEGRGSWEQDLEIADAKMQLRKVSRIANRMGSSINTIEARVAFVDDMIVAIRRQQEEILIPQAEEYLKLVQQRTEQLTKIHQAFGRGDLSPQTYRLREREFRALTGRPGREPDLKLGLELLKERQDQEKREQVQTQTQPPAQPGSTPVLATEPKPTTEPIILTPETIESTPARGKTGPRVVTTEIPVGTQGEIIRVPGKKLAEYARVAVRTSPEHPITIVEFKQQMQGGDQLSDNAIQSAISKLRKIFKPQGYDIVQAVKSGEYFNGQKGAWFFTEVEQPKPHQLTLFRDNNRLLKVTDSLIRLSPMETKIMHVLLGNIGRQVPSTKIEEAIYGDTPPAAASHLSDYLRRLKRKFNGSGAPEIFTIGIKKHKRWGMIANVEYGWADSATGERKHGTIPNLIQSRKDAVLSFMSNSDVTRETIINTLGLSKKTVRLLTWPQASIAMQHAANILYTRNQQRITTEEELMVWNQIKEYVGVTEDKQALTAFRREVDHWFRTGERKARGEEIIAEVLPTPLESFSEAEGAILALLIEYHRGVEIKPDDRGEPFRFEVDPELLQTCHQIYNRFIEAARVDMTREEYTAIRQTALAKLKLVLQNNQVESILDCKECSGEVENLLVWLFFKDQEYIIDVVDFLTKNPGLLVESEFGIVQTVRRVQKVDSKPQPTVQTEEGKPSKATSWEQQAASRIREIMDEILQHPEISLDSFVSPATVTRAFPKIKQKTIEQAVEKGIAKPLTNGTIRYFGVQEITIMLYSYENNWNLTPSQRKKLDRTVKAELEKRKSSQ